jgi:hypothetical protein
VPQKRSAPVRKAQQVQVSRSVIDLHVSDVSGSGTPLSGLLTPAVLQGPASAYSDNRVVSVQPEPPGYQQPVSLTVAAAPTRARVVVADGLGGAASPEVYRN